MLEMEDLIDRIVSSPSFKEQLHRQIQEWKRSENEPVYNQQPTTMSKLVEEVNSYITEITEFALEQENSKNYISFMHKNEQLCHELEKKINNNINSITQQLKEEIQNLKSKISFIATGPFQRNNLESKLKQERKMLTRNLLEVSRLHNVTEEGYTARKTYKNIKSTIYNTENMSENEGSSTIISESSWSRLSQLQNDWRKVSEEWRKAQIMISSFKNQQESQKQEWKNMKETAQAKLQGNLQSIWNVISDLCSRISKFQSMDAFETSQ